MAFFKFKLPWLLLIASLGLNVFLWRQLPVPLSTHAEQIELVEVPDDRTNAIPLTDTPEPIPSIVSGQDESSLQQSIASNDIDQLRQLLRDEDWPQLTVSLQEFLRANPDNNEALLIEAELVARTEPLGIALVNYYALLELPLEFETRKAIGEKIQQLFENATEQLRFDRAWDLLAELIEPLIQIEPDERRYLILLAEAYAQQANEVLMENVLAGLRYDDPAIASIRQILQRQIDQPDRDEQVAQLDAFTRPDKQSNITRIPLDRIGNQYTLELGFDNRPVRLMIDTGASTTAVTTRTWSRISSRVASQFIGVFKVNTAAGFIQAPMFTIKSISMGPLQFEDVSVMVIPSRMMGDDPERSPQGLLGMNILSQFNFQIDQQNATLLLSPR
ncbi:retropepsin-like aspartic protease [Alteromonas sp. ASW11-36]|uniref:Retropepsin-like aspartic protease n=1 Tax=Alteromonas arenosi TaxID=3055817 RepID=A0ABT7SVW9_9ALTE|nr:retropepsin-like aspartic protease [Alteromonas sp. ASW11-36]MDM7860313.1 retropepsin-like aspartic protease [Alteromonas sp. ASW11-36]